MSRTLESRLDPSKWRGESRASQGRPGEATEHHQGLDFRIERVNRPPSQSIITGVNFRLQDRWMGTTNMGRWSSFQCVDSDSPPMLPVNSAE